MVFIDEIDFIFSFLYVIYSMIMIAFKKEEIVHSCIWYRYGLLYVPLIL